MTLDTKQYVIEHLLSTKREGMEDLIAYMEECGFFEAPCSTKFHLASEFGLVYHTRNVMLTAENIGYTLLGKEKYGEIRDSVMIVSGLHDIGKMGQFGKPLYIEKKLKDGSTGKVPYETNDELLPVDHEIRSIAIAQMFIDLTEEEQFAILYHNGLYSNIGKYTLQGKETPLYMILHFADLWCSMVKEVKK